MVVVLITAAGAPWESTALALLERRTDVVVLKRCVDIDDLLATASAGQADAAVLALDAPGLDAVAVSDLRRYGVRPLTIVAVDHLDEGRLRAGRIGIRTVLADSDLDPIADLLTRPEPPATRPPAPAAPATAGQPGAPEPPSDTGRVLVVWGPAGAPGRTTVATGLAEALARRGPTTLVDADPYGGSIAQVLGVLDEVSGLLAAARLVASGELADQVATVQRRLGPSLTVVTGLPRPDRWTEVRPGTVETLLETVAAHGHAVADAGFCLEEQPGAGGARPGRNQLTLGALSAADEVVAVGTADPVGLSRLARGLVDLREAVGPVPVRVVVNRMRPSLGWSEREVAQMVASFASTVGLHFLPEDRPTVDQALVAGRTLRETAADSTLVVALDALAEAIVPGGAPPARGRLARRRVRQRTAGTARRR